MLCIVIAFIGFSLHGFAGNLFPIVLEESDVKIMSLAGNENISYKLKSDLDGQWYSSAFTIISASTRQNEDYQASYIGIKRDGQEVPLYRSKKGGTYFKTGRYLEQSLASIPSEEVTQAFRVIDYHDKGFFLVQLPNNKIRYRKAWINEKDISYASYSSGVIKNGEAQRVTQLKLNLAKIFNEKISAALPLSNILLADHLLFALKFYRGSYYSTNCGIHSFLAAMVMKEPSLLASLRNEEDLITDLERESLHENPSRVVNGAKLAAGAGALHMALAIEDPSQLIDIGTGVVAGLGFLGLGSFVPSLEKSVRKNIGIMPKKLEKLGEYFLKKIGLNERFKFVRTEKNDFDEVQIDWRRILENGSPIVAMKRNNLIGGHYVVIHSLLENGGAYVWDQGIFLNEKARQLEPERISKVLDCKLNKIITLTSFLAGTDHRYVYFHLEDI